MNWIGQLFSRRQIEEDLREEIEQHLNEKVEELVTSGMSRSEAKRVARREFGNVAFIEEQGRDVWRWVEELLVRLALRLSTAQKRKGHVPRRHMKTELAG